MDINDKLEEADVLAMDKLNQQWVLLTILQMPWNDTSDLDDEARDFLLKKAVEVKKFVDAQQQMQMQQQRQQQESSQQEQDSPILKPEALQQ